MDLQILSHVSFVPAACFSSSDLYLKLPTRSWCHPERMLSCSDSLGSCCCLSYLRKRVISCDRIKGSAQISGLWYPTLDVSTQSCLLP